MEGDPTSEEMQVPTESVESEKVGPEDEPSSSTPQESAEPSMSPSLPSSMEHLSRRLKVLACWSSSLS